MIEAELQLIDAELQTMDEAQLAALYPIVERIAQTGQREENISAMEKLRRIKIDAPEDFATNFELYANGEKSVE